MNQNKIIAYSILITLVALFGCAHAGANRMQNQQNPPSGDLRFTVPDGWLAEKPSSSMRVAQFKLPRAEGDSDDGSLVVYYFGPTQGGSVQDNVDRWIGQMETADGKPVTDKAKSETKTVNGLKVTTVDVTGTYTAQMSPGSADRHHDANYRLRAAIAETPKGNYFAKLVGPEKTIARWDEAFNAFVNSFAFK
jgi:hypothetical protein